jgi:hypothetical protein
MGLGSDRIAETIGLYRSRISTSSGAASGSSRSRRSCPAQKARPDPVSTTTRTALSRPASRNAARSEVFIGTVSAFRASGRSSVTVATAPSTS